MTSPFSQEGGVETTCNVDCDGADDNRPLELVGTWEHDGCGVGDELEHVLEGGFHSRECATVVHLDLLGAMALMRRQMAKGGMLQHLHPGRYSAHKGHIPTSQHGLVLPPAPALFRQQGGLCPFHWNNLGTKLGLSPARSFARQVTRCRRAQARFA